MKIVNRKINELIKADYNPRKISDKDFEQLKKSLETFECVEPIVINKHHDRDDIIVGGHQRLKAMESLGWQEVPTIEVNLNLEQEKELNVRLNKNTGEFDFELLAEHFEENNLIDFGFEEIDFYDDGNDYSDKNQEIDVDSFDDNFKIVLNYTEKDYLIVKNVLDENNKTPEQIIWELLGCENEEGK